MNKYITLAALIAAGSASAYAGNELNVATGGNFYAGNYAFSFTVAENQLSADDTSDVLALYWGTWSTGEYYANGFVLNYADTGITLSVGDGAMGNVAGDNEAPQITESTTFTSSRGATFSTALTAGNTYSVYNIGADSKQTVYLFAGEKLLDFADVATAGALESVSYNGNMNGGSADTVMNSVGNASYSVTAIPEPSAFGLLAGLGALALVGARRRRR